MFAAKKHPNPALRAKLPPNRLPQKKIRSRTMPISRSSTTNSWMPLSADMPSVMSSNAQARGSNTAHGAEHCCSTIRRQSPVSAEFWTGNRYFGSHAAAADTEPASPKPQSSDEPSQSNIHKRSACFLQYVLSFFIHAGNHSNLHDQRFVVFRNHSLFIDFSAPLKYNDAIS